MYSETTQEIKISVDTTFVEEQSEPDDFHFVWAYHIRIENNGSDRVQLRTRYWRITDANGHEQEVRGPGVVGEEPILDPGESYEYSSGCPLSTPSGIMAGSFGMEKADGEQFDVAVPAFSLDSPHQAVRLN